MRLELTNDDRCVVDLLLDRDFDDDETRAACFSQCTSVALVERFDRVEVLLEQLEDYQVEEPSPDLVMRTLNRCNESADLLVAGDVLAGNAPRARASV